MAALVSQVGNSVSVCRVHARGLTFNGVRASVGSTCADAGGVRCVQVPGNAIEFPTRETGRAKTRGLSKAQALIFE